MFPPSGVRRFIFVVFAGEGKDERKIENILLTKLVLSLTKTNFALFCSRIGVLLIYWLELSELAGIDNRSQSRTCFEPLVESEIVADSQTSDFR